MHAFWKVCYSPEHCTLVIGSNKICRMTQSISDNSCFKCFGRVLVPHQEGIAKLDILATSLSLGFRSHCPSFEIEIANVSPSLMFCPTICLSVRDSSIVIGLAGKGTSTTSPVQSRWI